MEKFLICFWFLIQLLSNGFAYIITVDSHSEECFFDKAEAGAKLGITEKFLLKNSDYEK